MSYDDEVHAKVAEVIKDRLLPTSLYGIADKFADVVLESLEPLILKTEDGQFVKVEPVTLAAVMGGATVYRIVPEPQP